jgi:hypothetical protein
MPRILKRLNQPQRMRVHCNEVSFYTTAKTIRDGVGDFKEFNVAAIMAITELDVGRAKGTHTTSIRGIWNEMEIYLEAVDYEYEL